MARITKPLLAGTVEDLETLKYPVIVSPKIDGIRCLKIRGKVVSRNLKPIPNDYIREILEEELPEGADGEILSGKTFQDCTSAVMTKDGQPKFKFYMFDYVASKLNKPYVDRIKDMENWYIDTRDEHPHVRMVGSHLISNTTQLLRMEKLYLKRGYEGLMIRSLSGRYKCGRSTVKEGILLKLKRFKSSEARILDIEELTINNNPAKINALGRTERSSHKENLVPGDTAGTLVLEDIYTEVQFRAGSGLDAKTRAWIWANKDKILSNPDEYLVKYKWFPKGVKDKPRFPIIEGIRHQNDMS